jgi:exodeoxyribonuclease-3
MKLCTFNVNGVRARIHQLQELAEKYSPDVIGLQEIKCLDDVFPKKEIEELGYHVESFGQKGHYGVALLSKTKPLAVKRGYPTDEEGAQRRMITGVYEINGTKVTILNGYFPQGEGRAHPVKFPAKQKFYADLAAYLAGSYSPSENLVIMGDMNVAPVENDIGIGEQNRLRWLRSGKSSFLPEEREWLKTVMDWGLTDLYRELFPDVTDQFSWFDYRSKGFDDNRGLRIDLILGTKSMANACVNMDIAYKVRGMEKPSDHAPVMASFVF